MGARPPARGADARACLRDRPWRLRRPASWVRCSVALRHGRGCFARNIGSRVFRTRLLAVELLLRTHLAGVFLLLLLLSIVRLAQARFSVSLRLTRRRAT